MEAYQKAKIVDRPCCVPPSETPASSPGAPVLIGMPEYLAHQAAFDELDVDGDGRLGTSPGPFLWPWSLPVARSLPVALVELTMPALHAG